LRSAIGAIAAIPKQHNQRCGILAPGSVPDR
jgi:hypothetical protein